MFRYRLHSPDGDDLGEATYVMMSSPGEEVLLGAGQPFRVLGVVPFGDEGESAFVGPLPFAGPVGGGASRSPLSAQTSELRDSANVRNVASISSRPCQRTQARSSFSGFCSASRSR